MGSTIYLSCGYYMNLPNPADLISLGEIRTMLLLAETLQEVPRSIYSFQHTAAEMMGCSTQQQQSRKVLVRSIRLSKPNTNTMLWCKEPDVMGRQTHLNVCEVFQSQPCKATTSISRLLAVSVRPSICTQTLSMETSLLTTPTTSSRREDFSRYRSYSGTIVAAIQTPANKQQ